MKEKPVCLSHIGQRGNHEDNFLFAHKFLTSNETDDMTDGEMIFLSASPENFIKFYAISDGMGGHNGGEVASLICTSRLAGLEKEIQYCRNSRELIGRIQSTIGEINNEINERAKTVPALYDMGATLILMVNIYNNYLFFNLGDSRAYYFNDEKLYQITTDNTQAERLLKMHLISENEMETVENGHSLTRYLGFDEPGVTLKADEYFYRIKKPGYILLCSDGITDYLDKREFRQILGSRDSILEKGKKLIRSAVKKENADNATVMIIPVSGKPNE